MWCNNPPTVVLLWFFLFGSLYLSWLFTDVCPDGNRFDAPIHTWFSLIYAKGPCLGGEAGGAVGWWCPSQLLPVGCDIHASLQICLVSTLNTAGRLWLIRRRCTGVIPLKPGSWWKKMSTGWRVGGRRLLFHPSSCNPAGGWQIWLTIYQTLQPQDLSKPSIDLRISLTTTSKVQRVPGKERCSFVLPTQQKCKYTLEPLGSPLFVAPEQL